jgi:uncharacterized RDD family membrane protein YckC
MNGSAAQRDESVEQGMYRATGTESASAFESGVLFDSGAAALKQIAAARLAEHRNRRAAVAATEAEHEALARARSEALRRESHHGASRVREAVAARYQQSVSYREYLAAEAQRALEQAEAEAEVARRNAQAVAAAQMQLLQEIEQWTDAQEEPSPRERALSEHRSASRIELADALVDIALGARELIAEVTEVPSGGPSIVELVLPVEPTSPTLVQTASAGLKVWLHEQLGGGPQSLAAFRPHVPAEAAAQAPYGEVTSEELDQLEQEIEFRRAPEFLDHTLETQTIQANIIEFPRQLIAARKARPRLAEGPLREDAAPQPQLRIFEVEPEQISFVPEDAPEVSGAPEWQSLLLDAAVPAPMPERDLDARSNPQTAALSQRLMALLVDACCVGCGMVGFVALVAEIAGPALRALALPALAATAAITLLVFALLYQALFFSLADATPGMRYARISLCTFNDENPSRKAMRRRIVALLLAVCPLGLGLLWMALDDDGLGWHDRISRMYPRAY